MDPRYSEAEIPKFFDMLAVKGVMKTATARARKFAVQKVLSVLDPAEKADVRKINRQDAINRFNNKFGQEFHPDSLATYAQRFNVGLDDFIAWVDNPAGFRPSTGSRAPRVSRQTADQSRAGSKKKPESKASIRSESPPNASGLIAIPVPLPSGGIAQLYVPHKMTAQDADRIAAVVKALAVGESAGSGG